MSTWASAVPAFAVVLALVLVPGGVMAYAAGLRGLLAWGLAPSVGFTALTLSPVIARLLSVPWSARILVISGLVWVVVAWCAGLALRLWWQASRRPHSAPPPTDSRRTLLVAAGSVLVGAGAVLSASLTSIGTPGELVDSTDVVAHLNRIRAFLDSGSFSSLGPPAAYPSGFHDLAGSAMVLLPGLDIVAAANLTALAAAAVFFPLGCVVLARLVFDCRPVVLVAAGLGSAAMTTFPFTLMGWGVLWPNLLATALLPGVLGPALVAAGVVGVDDGSGRRRVRVSRTTAGLGVLLALPGFALCHPNGLVSLVMFVVIGLITVRVRRGEGAVQRRPLVEAGALLLAIFLALLVLPRVSRQVADTMSYEPSSTTAVLPALREIGLLSLDGTGLQFGVLALGLVGLVFCGRRRELRWVVAVEAVCLLLYVLAAGPRTAAGDLLTGYWYNDKYRLAALAAVPLLLLLVAAVLAVTEAVRTLLVRLSPPDGERSRLPLGASSLVALLVLIVVTGGLSHSVASGLVSRYYHPPQPEAVLLTPQQHTDLARLAALIPATVVTADVPANGSGLLYALYHRKVLFDSLLLNPDPDSALIGLHLRDVSVRTDVCDALRRTNVQYAITGAITYRLNLAERTVGMDDLSRATGFTQVGEAGRYRLYRIDACGFGQAPPQP
ncbi:MAG: DUF6541 family protein [Lapillicoccus sp.]